MSERSATDVAVERQGRYELFFVTLTFAVAGLAVETADLGNLYLVDIAEVCGWAVLLISALTGLRRLELMPTHYRLQGYKQDLETKRFEASKFAFTNPNAHFVVPMTGQKVLWRDYVAEGDTEIPKVDERLKEIDVKLSSLYTWQRYGFLVGVGLLGIARASPAIARAAALLGYELL